MAQHPPGLVVPATADVVVIGGGGAGLAAAIESAVLGAKVILAEKAEQLGGSTGWSVGSLTASGTVYQTRRGIADNVAAHSEDLSIMNARVRPETEPELREFLVRKSPETLVWLQMLGVEFVGPFEEPPHRVPRMHNVIPGSRAYVERLSRRARELGVTILCNTSAQSLQRKDEEVCGINLISQGKQFSVSAGAVILATGDLSASPNALGPTLKNMGSGLTSVNRHATGDGHKIAIQAGAAVSHEILAKPTIRFMPSEGWFGVHNLPTHPWFARFMRFGFERFPMRLMRPLLLRLLGSVLQPDSSIFKTGAILVNCDGEIFCDDPAHLATELTHQPGGMGYILFDHQVTQRYSEWPHFLSTAPGLGYIYIPDLCRYRRDVCRIFDNIVDLAVQTGMSPELLVQSVKSHNEKQRLGGFAGILEAPFVALGPVRPFLVLTDGGLKVDPKMQVRKPDGGILPGLYAAGSTGQGDLLLQGHGHHLAWAFTSGREAGVQAASYALKLRTEKSGTDYLG